MKRTETISLDFDWLWRVGLPRLLRAVGSLAGRSTDAVKGLAARVCRRFGERGRHYFGAEDTADGKNYGVFARAWPIGTTALWIAVLLSAYAFFYYL